MNSCYGTDVVRSWMEYNEEVFGNCYKSVLVDPKEKNSETEEIKNKTVTENPASTAKGVSFINLLI